MSSASIALGIVRHDLRAIRRDHVALGTIVLSALGTVVVTVLGAVPHRLPGWSDWFPFMVAASLVGGPAGFGFLFGLVMVDEGDSGVRDALAVTPVRPTAFMLTRTSVATLWMAVWPLASIHVMNATWRAADLPLVQWMAVAGPLVILTPAFALLIPGLAADKIGALAALKGLSFLSLAPLALFLVPEDAWFRPVFLVSPTAWVVEAMHAFLERAPAVGYRLALGGIVYGAVILTGALSRFRRKVYALHR